jgi:septum formation inhibitor MinC
MEISSEYVAPAPLHPPPVAVALTYLLQDLEEIEEWNEFGELRMIVNSVQDLDGMPATSHPAPVTESPAPAPKQPEPTTPKPSTIKIQSPPATPKPEDKKDEQAVLALRLASSEAASKAKSKADEKKEESKKEEDPRLQSSSPSKAHRGSVAPELPDIAPDSPTGPKRPPLVPEVAAVSSANFRVENAEELGLVQHHRGSIIAASDNADKDKVVTEIRQSISAEGPVGGLDALRKEAKERSPDESIEEVPSAEEEEKKKDVKAEEKEVEEKKDDPSESKEEPSTPAQDTKSVEETAKE